MKLNISLVLDGGVEGLFRVGVLSFELRVLFVFFVVFLLVWVFLWFWGLVFREEKVFISYIREVRGMVVVFDLFRLSDSLS